MNVLEVIKTRRSVRSYTDQPIEDEKIDKIIEAARWTPSGKNGQPWKFKIVTDKSQIKSLSELSIYGSWMKTATCFVIVFLNKQCSYDYVKDIQSCGAAMQNMMLMAHFLDVGSCWIGEILPKANEVKTALEIGNENLQLMGIITLGYKKGRVINLGRKSTESFLL